MRILLIFSLMSFIVKAQEQGETAEMLFSAASFASEDLNNLMPNMDMPCFKPTHKVELKEEAQVCSLNTDVPIITKENLIPVTIEKYGQLPRELKNEQTNSNYRMRYDINCPTNGRANDYHIWISTVWAVQL